MFRRENSKIPPSLVCHHFEGSLVISKKTVRLPLRSLKRIEIAIGNKYGIILALVPKTMSLNILMRGVQLSSSLGKLNI